MPQLRTPLPPPFPPLSPRHKQRSEAQQAQVAPTEDRYKRQRHTDSTCSEGISASLRSPFTTLSQFLVAIGVSFLLADVFLFFVRSVPFTHFRKSSITDLPLVIVRYVILFPLFVAVVVHNETWIEASPLNLIKTLLFLVALHLLLREAHARSLNQSSLNMPPEEADEFPQRLGLRDF